uniref:Large ribosomal subunit protein mL64 n=1 Tax=Syphacia muris TaxID=451379 RepID=A0A0N5AU23_9BILA
MNSFTFLNLNCFGLNERHRLIAEGKIPLVTYEWEKEKWGKRMRFGKYGLASGVSPSDLWPTVEEVEEEESFHLYRPFSEVMKEVKSSAEKRKSMLQRRMEELAKNESNYENRLKQYEASLVKVEEKKSEAEAKMEKRILEIQEYFGYRIDPKDPRFEVMFQQKEAEEKKATFLMKLCK